MGAAINLPRIDGPGEHLSLPIDRIEIFTGDMSNDTNSPIAGSIEGLISTLGPC